jgi:surface antigen
MIRTFIATSALSALVLSGPAQALDPNVSQQQPRQTTTTGSVQPVMQAQDESTARSSSGGSGLLGGIFGCSASGGSQGTGAIIGGLAGAFLGNRIAGSGSRTLGTLLGGALGAAAGSAIGCKLQKNDRDRAERAAQQALETGQNQSWTNAETGAAGHVEVANGATAPGASGIADLRFAQGVEPASGYTKVGDSFTTSANANLRGGPATNAPVRATLPAGQRVWVPAQVKGQPWMLVSENGVGQGYVSSGLLKKSTAIAANNCKLVTQSVSVPGETEQSESYQACKGNDGQWTMTKV